MICQRCLRKAFSPRSFSSVKRTLATTGGPTTAAPRPDGRPAATTTSAAQPFSTPLTPPEESGSPEAVNDVKIKVTTPKSITPAGTVLRGLNYLKNRDDPVALPDEEYPEWLWRVLDDAKKDGADAAALGDEFSKSKKQRRLAAKRQRKLEAQALARGDVAPKIPIQQQSIDLPYNTQGTVAGALKAAKPREEIRKALRAERRAKIKETNYLKSM